MQLARAIADLTPVQFNKIKITLADTVIEATTHAWTIKATTRARLRQEKLIAKYLRKEHTDQELVEIEVPFPPCILHSLHYLVRHVHVRMPSIVSGGGTALLRHGLTSFSHRVVLGSGRTSEREDFTQWEPVHIACKDIPTTEIVSL
jgi:hypothetical protein